VFGWLKKRRASPASPRGCTVSKGILAGTHRVGVAKRQAPVNPADSGWSFEGAAEDRASLASADGWSVASLDTVVQLEPRVQALLDAPEGSVFLLDHDGDYKKLAPAAARAFLD
jgi:hypothetical protein